jgi:hypothetical protein
MNKGQLEEITKAKASLFKEVFSTVSGIKVLKLLEEECNADELRSPDPHNTYFNLGRRDAVVYIKQMINYSERNNETND